MRKTKKVSVLSDSEDEVIKDDEKDSTQSKASKKKESEKPRTAIAPNELFGKKPITRIEETKVSRKLQKVVNII